MSQSALREADQAGETFARGLSWLGLQEQEEIATRFAQHHLRLRRQALRAVVERSEELRTEYSRRYTTLRTRLIGTCLTLCALCIAAAILLATA
ncbi:hypothetical protein AB0953_30670 [Streptomyces sp. NPDC046866]|uniref:hypothetical protein n=1 Tax=Streptomyces sp. NPDC046866 TaxID=3154921 RepID=UPI003453BAF8